MLSREYSVIGFTLIHSFSKTSFQSFSIHTSPPSFFVIIDPISATSSIKSSIVVIQLLPAPPFLTFGFWRNCLNILNSLINLPFVPLSQPVVIMASARIENDVPEAFMASARFEYNVPAAPMTSPQFNYRLPVPTEVSTRFDIQVQHAQNQVLANFHSKTQQQLAALTQWSNHRLHHLKKIMKDDPPAHLTPRAHSIRRALVAVQIRELKTLLGPNRLRKEIQYEQDMLLEGFQNTSIEALEDMIEVRDWELQLLRQFEDYTLSPDVCLHQAYVIALRKAELWDLYQLKCAWTRAVVGQYDFGGTMGGAAFCEGDEILEAEGVQSRAWEEEQRARQLEFAGDVPELVSSEEMPDLLISEET